MIQFEEIKFKNPGVLLTTIPDETWKIVSEAVENQILQKDILKKFKIMKLGVGGINESIKFSCPQVFVEFCKDFVNSYNEYYNLNAVSNIVLDSTWINLQKKYEYRPYHTHDTNLSFIFWYKIPFKLEEEDRHSNNINSKLSNNGRLSFMVDSLIGEKIIQDLDVDASYEGKMILFHSKIWHSVFPFFTSDDYRVSVAGNIYLQ